MRILPCFSLWSIKQLYRSLIFSLVFIAAISLANWSTNEENAAIQDTCERMYELTMLLSSVIDLFSKEVRTYFCSALSLV